MGKYKLYRKDIYIDNYIPPIMSKEKWNQAQNLLQKKIVHKTHPEIDEKFSKLLYCTCGSRLSKKIDYRTKIPTVRYICDRAYVPKLSSESFKCENRLSIREDVIENYLIENLDKYLRNYIVKIENIKTTQKKIDNSSKIKTIEKKLEKLKDLYIDDLINKDSYKKDFEKYNKELLELKTQEIVKPQKDISHIKNILNSDWKNIYFKLTEKNKRKFWFSIIDIITIRNGKIEKITFL